MENKILKKSDYSIVQNNYKINLYDDVLMYSVGNDKFRIIDIYISLSYPIIYDIYEQDEDITIILCPISLRAIALKGIFKINSYVDNILILEDNEQNVIPINMKYKIDKNHIIYSNKRFDVKIMKLKNALIYSTDSTFILPNNNIVLDTIFPISYYNNFDDIKGNKIKSKYHPKTLCYVVVYINDSNKKNTKIIIGNDVDKNEISGYNLDKSKFSKYLNKNKEKIIENNVFIMPILYYIALNEYDKKLFIEL